MEQWKRAVASGRAAWRPENSLGGCRGNTGDNYTTSPPSCTSLRARWYVLTRRNMCAHLPQRTSCWTCPASRYNGVSNAGWGWRGRGDAFEWVDPSHWMGDGTLGKGGKGCEAVGCEMRGYGLGLWLSYHIFAVCVKE